MNFARIVAQNCMMVQNLKTGSSDPSYYNPACVPSVLILQHGWLAEASRSGRYEVLRESLFIGPDRYFRYYKEPLKLSRLDKQTKNHPN
jgi:hypothetical protein